MNNLYNIYVSREVRLGPLPRCLLGPLLIFAAQIRPYGGAEVYIGLTKNKPDFGVSFNPVQIQSSSRATRLWIALRQAINSIFSENIVLYLRQSNSAKMVRTAGPIPGG